jgi:hypothetical protein
MIIETNKGQRSNFKEIDRIFRSKQCMNQIQKIKICILLTILLLGGPSSAKDFSNRKTIRLYVASSPISYKISPTGEYNETNPEGEADPEILEYSSNSLGETGVAIGYKGYTVSYGFPQEQSDEEIIDKGTTTGSNYRIALNRGGYSLDVFHKDLTGFYLANVDKIDSSWSREDPFPQFKNMNIKNSGIQATFVLSPKSFSLPALMDQTDIQKKSGGSIIGGLGVEVASIENDGPIVYSVYQDQYGDDGSMEWTKTQNLTLKLGGGYTLVYGSLYLGGKLLFGQTSYRSTNSISPDETLSGSARAQTTTFGLGYNANKHFAGFSYDHTVASVRYTNIESETKRINTEFFIGKRF